MKKIVALALCSLFIISAAEARTLYVNAKRPNNKGNGLKASTAKKTIQAAINVARKGDTILVYPGTYAPIKTNNKKITIKSIKGKSKTKIKAHNSAFSNRHALNLGKGNATTVIGFFVCQSFAEQYGYGGNVDGAAFGGIVRNSTFSRMGGMYDANKVDHTFYKTRLADCVLEHCAPGTSGMYMLYGSSLNRCKITGSGTRYGGNFSKAIVKKCKLINCLGTGNVDMLEPEWTQLAFIGCTLLNCTVAENADVRLKSSVAVNSVFYKSGYHVSNSKAKNRFSHCLLSGSPRFVDDPVLWAEEVQRDYWTETTYRFFSGDCRLRRGSPCIDKGKLTEAQKKLVGTKDLAGRKRIRGKAIDCGCYEY